MGAPFNLEDVFAGKPEQTNWPTDYCELHAPKNKTPVETYIIDVAGLPMVFARNYDNAVKLAEAFEELMPGRVEMRWTIEPEAVALAERQMKTNRRWLEEVHHIDMKTRPI